jgi:hypothetical protein
MKKVLVFSLIVGFFLFHLICTILYNAPINPVTKDYQVFVANYMDPLFSQKWLLFAPEPATNELRLWYRVKTKDNWGHWNDPLEPILRRHQKMRFTYNAKLLYVYGNIAKDLSTKSMLIEQAIKCEANDATCIRAKNDSLVLSSEFGLALKYVRRDLLKTQSIIDSVQLMVVQIYPNQFSERLSKKPFGFVNTTEIKPIAY